MAEAAAPAIVAWRNSRRLQFTSWAALSYGCGRDVPFFCVSCGWSQMDYQSLLRSTLMSEPSKHALVPRSECQILPASQSHGALAGMVADALAIVATQAPSLSRGTLAILIADDDGPLLDYLVELLTPTFH